jgi:hypothetical protein
MPQLIISSVCKSNRIITDHVLKQVQYFVKTNNHGHPSLPHRDMGLVR